MYRLCCAVYLALAVSAAAHAHEFWIEPSRFEVAASDRIVADLRVGQYFKGNSQVYLPNAFVSFTVTDPAGTRPVTGRIGDLPAVSMPAERSGLHVLAYHSTPSSITYSSFEKFESFTRKQGIEWVIEAHRRRGLPEKDVTESFTRYAKTLIRVGNGDGSDRAEGLPFELVAETNPYTNVPDDDMTVRLLLKGEPHADAQITVFRKFIGCEATRLTLHTDADGRARIPRKTGGRFLVNAVYMREPAPESDAAWESLWASLTFRLPENTGDGEEEPCDSAAGSPETSIR